MRFNPTETETTDEEVATPTPNISHYLKLCLKVGYYSLVVPFFPIDNKEGYTLKYLTFQKILTYFAWACGILRRGTVLRLTYQKWFAQPSTILYFNLAHAHFHLILYFCFYKTLVEAPEKIKQLLNLITKSNLLHQNAKRNNIIRWFIFPTQAIWIFLIAIAPFIGYDHINSYEWSPSKVFKAYVVQARYTFFLNSNVTSKFYYENAGEIRGIDVFIGIIQILIGYAQVSQLFVITSVFGNCAVVLWSGAYGFAEFVQNLDKNEASDMEDGAKVENKARVIAKALAELQGIANLLNNTFHLVTFWYILDTTAWLSTELDNDLQTPDVFVKVHVTYYLVYVGIGFVLSAEAFRKMEWTRQWLENKREVDKLEACSGDLQFISNYQISQISKRIEYSKCGIGSVGFFKINYSFIGQVLGLIITFFIISVQYGTPKDQVE